MGWFSIGAAALGLLGAKKSNKVNQSLNDAQLAFARENAQNAHQWEVEDLRKAGLNPILSAGGSGASVSTPSLIPFQNELQPAVNNALSSRMNEAQVKQMEKQTELLEKSLPLQIDTLMQELANSASMQEKLQAEIANIRENTRNQQANNFWLKEGIDIVKPFVDDIKNSINSAQSDTSVFDSITSGAKELWNDWFGDDLDKPTPNHLNNDYMKGRRGRS